MEHRLLDLSNSSWFYEWLTVFAVGFVYESILDNISMASTLLIRVKIWLWNKWEILQVPTSR